MKSLGRFGESGSPIILNYSNSRIIYSESIPGALAPSTSTKYKQGKSSANFVIGYQYTISATAFQYLVVRNTLCLVNHRKDFVTLLTKPFLQQPDLHIRQRGIASPDSTASGINSTLLSDSPANSRHASISSGPRSLYSSTISLTVAPCANRFMINSTVKRVPVITGLPIITFGFTEIRFKRAHRPYRHYIPQKRALGQPDP
jgi:hypothetical protein